jgi:hypothetical protein
VGARVPSGTGRIQYLSLDDVPPIIEDSFSALSGLHSKIVLFFFDDCFLRGEKQTRNLSIEYVSNCVESTVSSVKKTIQRLEQRCIIFRTAYKDGRGGWSQYQLHAQIYQELLLTKAQVGSTKVETKWRPAEPAEAKPAPEVQASNQLPADWSQVDCEPLSSIGFTGTHVRQIFGDKKLTAKDVQDSIHYFAFDLSRNGRAKLIKGNPIGFFMGILRKGNLYTPPANYESVEDIERRRRIEALYRLESQRIAERKKLEDLEFQKWKANLSIDERKTLVPWTQKDSGPMVDAALREVFTKSKQSEPENL